MAERFESTNALYENECLETLQPRGPTNSNAVIPNDRDQLMHSLIKQVKELKMKDRNGNSREYRTTPPERESYRYENRNPNYCDRRPLPSNQHQAITVAD